MTADANPNTQVTAFDAALAQNSATITIRTYSSASATVSPLTSSPGPNATCVTASAENHATFTPTSTSRVLRIRHTSIPRSAASTSANPSRASPDTSTAYTARNTGSRGAPNTQTETTASCQ